MFPIIKVDPHKAEALEPLGTKRKFWYSDNGRRFLFKAEERGTGEDWAEKIACELAQLLGLPHVHYQLAVEQLLKEIPSHRMTTVCRQFTMELLKENHKRLVSGDDE